MMDMDSIDHETLNSSQRMSTEELTDDKDLVVIQPAMEGSTVNHKSTWLQEAMTGKEACIL